MSAGARTRATAGCVVIDACAAPGNKTTQLAAAVGETGTHAFERNRKRAATLRATKQERPTSYRCTRPISPRRTQAQV